MTTSAHAMKGSTLRKRKKVMNEGRKRELQESYWIMQGCSISKFVEEQALANIVAWTALKLTSSNLMVWSDKEPIFRVHMLAAFSKTSAIDLGGSATYSVQQCNKADAIMVQFSQEVALLYSFSLLSARIGASCVHVSCSRYNTPCY